MGDRSKIEWTDATWPIVQGCDPVSQGCVRCYAVPLLHRLAHNPNQTISAPLHGLVEKHVNAAGETILRFTGKLALREDRLGWPLGWKKPRMIFVPSHGDIFHKDVPNEFLDKIFAVMALCPQHTFQILTKRPERMRSYLTRMENFGDEYETVMESHAFVSVLCEASDLVIGDHLFPWPLPNVWLGTSCEDQATADERIPHLLQTPAAIRFVSCEPLLGPIHLGYLGWPQGDGNARTGHNALIGARYENGNLVERLPRLDWIIVGGESGPGARPMHPDWARSLRDQCAAVDVKYFFKQWGAFAPTRTISNGWFEDNESVFNKSAKAAALVLPGPIPNTSTLFERIGKKAAGRLLDGREHNEYPEAKA